MAHQQGCYSPINSLPGHAILSQAKASNLKRSPASAKPCQVTKNILGLLLLSVAENVVACAAPISIRFSWHFKMILKMIYPCQPLEPPQNTLLKTICITSQLAKLLKLKVSHAKMNYINSDSKWKAQPDDLAISRPFLAIFLATSLISLIKLRFWRSFWCAQLI